MVTETNHIYEPTRSGDLELQFVGWLEHDYIPQPSIQFSPCGQLILTHTARYTYVWKCAALTLQQRLEWGTKGTFSGDGRHIVVRTRGRFSVVDVESGRQVLRLAEPGPAHGPRHFGDRPSRVTIYHLAFSQLASQLFIGLSAQYKKPRPPDHNKDFYYGSRGQSLVRNAFDGTVVREFLDTTSMAQSSDTRFWVTGSKSGIAIYDTATLQPVLHLDRSHRGRYQFSQDNTVLSRVDRDERKWHLIDFPTGEPIATHDLPERGTLSRPTFFTYVLPDTIWAYNVETAELIDGVTGNVIQNLDDWPPREYPCVSPSGRLLTGVDGQTLYLRDLATGEELKLTDDRFDRLNHIVFSAREDRLFVMPARPFRVTSLLYRRNKSPFTNGTFVYQVDLAEI